MTEGLFLASKSLLCPMKLPSLRILTRHLLMLKTSRSIHRSPRRRMKKAAEEKDRVSPFATSDRGLPQGMSLAPTKQ
jgi:hypothetical protein